MSNLSIPDLGEECNEFKAMIRRISKNGKPDYSAGHKRMYRATIEMLRGKPCSILEIGSGIGYGLKLMDSLLISLNYQGMEPCLDSLKYLQNSVLPGLKSKNVEVSQDSWMVYQGSPRDYVFCIEVIEHVPEYILKEFLKKVRENTIKNFFMSTPCASTSPHGAKTSAEWKRLLEESGFSVARVCHQWTDLYICE